jgi:Ala-tRNA(Pro) deacylase
MATPDPTQLFRLLDTLAISHVTHTHPPFFTVDEGRAFKSQMPGGHSKNLFLKDKKGGLFLIVAWAETPVDLTAVAKRVAHGRFSFASAEVLRETLGVGPGSVTPFALINDRDTRVTAIVDARLLEHDPLYFHPLTNAASTAISADGLLRFLSHLGYSPLVMSVSHANLP